MIKPKEITLHIWKRLGWVVTQCVDAWPGKPSPLGWTLLPDLQHGHLQHVWRRCPGGGLRGGKGVGDVFYVQGAVKKSGSCQKFIARVQTNTFRLLWLWSAWVGSQVASRLSIAEHKIQHLSDSVENAQSLLLFTHCEDGSKFKKQWATGFALVVECESFSVTVTKFNPFPFAIFNPLVYKYDIYIYVQLYIQYRYRSIISCIYIVVYIHIYMYMYVWLYIIAHMSQLLSH